MKLYSFVTCAIFLIALSCSSLYAQDSIKVTPKLSDSQIDANYLKGVKSNNMGLRISSTYYLGERQSSDAVIPLMNELHTDKAPEARIMAALSLFKIGDKRGIYAIEQSAKNDKSEWVRNMCDVFYKMSQANKKPGK